MESEASDSQEQMRELLGPEVAARLEARNQAFPAWGKWSREILFGEVWQRPQLTKMQRSMVTVGVLAALGRDRELEIHIDVAMRNGLTMEELAEVFQHVGFYAGWPAAGAGLSALARRAEASEQRGENQ